jgi:peptide/nickel transport system permease protein
MLVYLAKRLFAMLLTLVGITLVTFFIIQAAPGDPVAASMGKAEGGAEAAGDAGARDRREDAIKTKKKLLGMLVEDRSVRTWDVATSLAGKAPKAVAGKQLPPVRHTGSLGAFAHWAKCLAASQDGGLLFAGTSDKLIHVLDAKDGTEIRAISGHAGEVWALAVSPDGATIASADSEGEVRFHAVADGRELGAAKTLGKSVHTVVYLPDGSRVVTACDDGIVRIHDAPSGAVVAQWKDHTSAASALAVSKDGARVWSAGADRKVREWDVAAGKLARVTGSAGAAVRCLALSPDGAKLAAACDDRRVYVFDVSAAGEAPVVLEGHWKAVSAVAWASDNRTLYTGSKDETIRSWDVAEKRGVAQTPAKTGDVSALLLSADGVTLWSAADAWSKVPVWSQYGTWLSRVARFDFDRSFRDDEKVIDKIKDALPVTIGLNVIAIFLIYSISIPLGVKAAVQRGSFFDVASSIVLFLLYSLPTFWVATMLIMSLSSERSLNIFECVGLHSPNAVNMSYLDWLKDWGLHLVLPITVMIYTGFSSLSRYARTSLLETLAQDYIRTARAKGLPEHVVVFKHALRNSMITIITLVASLLPAMIGGSVIVEQIFTIQGMGNLGFQAILERDYPVIMATTTFSAFLTLLGVLVSDLLYVVVDPRISHE